MWKIFFLLFIGVYPFQQAAGLKKDPSSNEIPWVSFCDLLKSPELYEGKEVRTKVVYRHGGEELAEFYCGECLAAGRVSVDFDQSFDSNTTSRLAKKIEQERTLSLIVIGKFHSSNHGYGHLNRYRFLFVIARVEKAKVLLKNLDDPNTVPKNVLSRVCCT